jgi:hypothetical protein
MKDFVLSMLAGRPHQQPFMDADKGGGAGDGGSGGDGGQGGQGGQGDGGGSGGSDDDDPDKDKDKDKDDPVKFDDRQQAEIQKIIDRTIAKERAKADEEKRKAEERAKMTADQKAEADRKEAEEKAKEREQKANDRLINMEIRDVARDLGVSAKKLERFLKVVDRDDIAVDDEGNINRSKVETAVKAVLADMPEFKGTDNPKGPGSGFDQGGAVGAKYTMAQIQAMTPGEVAKNYDDVMKSMAIHQQK